MTSAQRIKLISFLERKTHLSFRFASIAVFSACAACFCTTLPGATKPSDTLQFDVFLGYDGIVPEATWFPVICEVKNDGPPFTGVIEIEGGNYDQGQTRRTVVELPTGTLKRIDLPVFSNSRGYGNWDIRLLDERGKVRAEQIGVRPRKEVASITPLIGALPRAAGGTPSMRQILPQQSELQPLAARIPVPIFPDNPLVLEGLDSVYLSSERAPDLRLPNQVDALYAWLHAGGHLIVAVEQITDINSTPWLRNLFPVELAEIQNIQRHPELQEWLRKVWDTNVTYAPSQPGYPGRTRTTQRASAVAPSAPFSDLADDFTFEAAELQVATGKVRDGNVLVAAGDTPLIVTAQRGRGRVTALLFSPEREPFRSWKNLSVFWSKLIGVPGAWYASSDFGRQGGWSSDGIFGAMLDTKQVHKLPIEWLLLLLIVYLLIIGPVDHFWLKRIGKPMLTWITFPCYVVMFSLLIYFIGYKLRAGESEWNELHIVDVLPNGEKAELRGRTYASIYSPVNQKYTLEGHERFATFRGEFVSSWGAGQSGEKATVLQNGDNFKADIFVPVWTSQLFVSDWWQPAATPLSASVQQKGSGWEVKVDNRTERTLTNAQVVLDGTLFVLGQAPANKVTTFTISREQGTALRDFVWRQGQHFQNAVNSRQHTFGRETPGVTDVPNGTVAASFLSQLAQQQNYMSFISPSGLDLSGVVERGSAVLLAWDGGYSPVKSMPQFSPRRSHRDTLWRVAVPIQ